MCPPGLNSWCKRARTKAEGSLADFEHPKPLDANVQKVLSTIYEELSSDELLQRCVSRFTQNDNESFNKTVWQIAPKHTFYGAKTIEIVAFITACTFKRRF
ncbi:hypothetical protein J437_LFUL014674 [Ladona fulva]|uniref:Uncharacterized protein n=1 Tax=Ladona fulva TaxID=123851 RepID=A0A8K0KTH0_LADFU|nr:hypothetical protein J437_LFUL014674 [Ladona fulva]